MTDSLTRVIDLKKLRDEENYRSGVIRKGVEPEVIDDVLLREEVCRKLLREVEELRSQQNAASKDIGRASPEERDAKIAAASSIAPNTIIENDAVVLMRSHVRGKIPMKSIIGGNPAIKISER